MLSSIKIIINGIKKLSEKIPNLAELCASLQTIPKKNIVSKWKFKQILAFKNI